MRTRYVMRNGKLTKKVSNAAYANIMSDIEEFKTQDGTPITSRSQLREYEKRMGVRQVGNDWTGSTKPPWWDIHLERMKGSKIEP